MEDEMPEPDSTEQDMPKNPDKIDEEDEVEQKNRDANPQAMPSNNDPTAEDKAENAQMDRGTDDNVETNADQKKDEEAAPFVSIFYTRCTKKCQADLQEYRFQIFWNW